MRLCSLAPLLLVPAFFLATPAQADEHAPPPQVVVNGEGSATMAPDMALLTLTVTREADTAGNALAQNSKAMAAVIEQMEKMGIDERDLQTGRFSINPRYTHPRNSAPGESRKLVGYIVSNSLSVRVRDIDQVGTVIDKSVALGVNEGGNIVFTNDDPSEALARARVAAVKDARERAEILAEAADVDLGDVLLITEQSHQPRPVATMARVAMAESSADVPIATGENTYRVSVEMRFVIDD